MEYISVIQFAEKFGSGRGNVYVLSQSVFLRYVFGVCRKNSFTLHRTYTLVALITYET